MSARRSTSVATLVAMLLASVVVHLALWPAVSKLVELEWGGAPLPVGGGVMEVALLPSGAEAEPPDAAQEEERPPEAPPIPDGKVVHLDRVEDERPPEDTKFLSEFDSRTEHQTRAPNGRPSPPAHPTERGDRPDANDRAQTPPADPSRALALQPTRATPRRGEGEGAPTAPTGAADDGRLSRREGGALAPPPGIPGLRGSPEAMRRAIGQPGTLDDLRGVDPGSETLLNSRRWRYASFFNRVRDGVAQHWHPEVEHRKRDPEGRIYGMQTRITRLVIVLEPDGSLARVRMDKPSGADYLDEEAIRAVRAAAPFANPPAGLVDPRTGLIEFGFGFIFELRGGRRIFRYRR